MALWNEWLAAISWLIETVSEPTGFGLGLGIVAATLVLRAALLPVSWTVAYRGQVRQRKLLKLKPDLERLRTLYADQPELYTRRMLELYKKNGIAFLDGKSLVAALAQLPVLLGMFQVLRAAGAGARFLWVASLARPDVVLAAVAALTTAAMGVFNPDIPQQLRWLMIALPSIVAFLAALHFCSALALYWATSNCFTIAQMRAVRFVVERRIRRGALAF
jgi:YidC/Oxa1 family membrane protein insertase